MGPGEKNVEAARSPVWLLQTCICPLLRADCVSSAGRSRPLQPSSQDLSKRIGLLVSLEWTGQALCRCDALSNFHCLAACPPA